MHGMTMRRARDASFVRFIIGGDVVDIIVFFINNRIQVSSIFNLISLSFDLID